MDPPKNEYENLQQFNSVSITATTSSVPSTNVPEIESHKENDILASSWSAVDTPNDNTNLSSSQLPQTPYSTSHDANTSSSFSNNLTFSSSTSSQQSRPLTVSHGSKKSLGAKKATKVINFEDAARRAKEEQERLEAEATERAKYAHLSTRPAVGANEVNSSIKNTSSSNTSRLAFGANQNINTFATTEKGKPSHDLGGLSSGAKNNEMDRLGAGMGRLGFGFDPNMDFTVKKSSGTNFGSSSGFGSVTTKSSNASSEGNAQLRFANAKSISSDQYFERGSYDAQEA